MYALSDYAYELPKERIAQFPSKERSRSRLFHIHRATDKFSHHRFADLAQLLKSGDVLVINDTKVVPARLWGRKKTGGRVEVLVVDYAAGIRQFEKTGVFQCDCLVKASRNPGQGDFIYFDAGVKGEVVKKKGYLSEIRFSGSADIPAFIKRNGQLPLPPYISRGEKNEISDRTDYQTVYAANEGAVAAPTAGLHFTDALLAALEEKGIKRVPVTLHVGYGTFVPVRVDDIRDHQIHTEFFKLSRRNADIINQAKKNGNRIVAVGTTSVRTLEFLSDDKGVVRSGSGSCNLFIYPGYRFKCVDVMITNFHLPESTLLMLVSAFYNREKILEAYQEAIKKKYRFFSYGDAMLMD